MKIQTCGRLSHTIPAGKSSWKIDIVKLTHQVSAAASSFKASDFHSSDSADV